MSEGPAPLIAIAQENGERRRRDRRAQPRPLDTLFAVTLINQIEPAEAEIVEGYAAARGPRAGIAFNLSV